MNSVQFLKGEFQKLGEVPLTPGAIFFTEDTRQLFVDTDTARLPVAADQVAGKIFWVYLEADKWGEDYTQTVNFYYNEKATTIPQDLDELINEDSIMFLGKIDYDNPNADGIKPAVVSSTVTNDSITFRCFSVDPETPKLPNSDIWVQIYCPNPNVRKLISVDVFRTVFTARLLIPGNAWKNGENGSYYYKIHVPNVNFSNYPFIVNLSDDSLENRYEFQKLSMSTDGEDIVFTSEATIEFNINVDVCVFLGPGSLGGKVQDVNQKEAQRVDWMTVAVTSMPTISNSEIKTSNVGLFSEIGEKDERKFLVFCTENRNRDFAKIKTIDYEETTVDGKQVGNIIFSLKEDVTSIDSGFTCVIVQLNNISNVREGSLQGIRNETSGTDAPTYDGWVETNSSLNYYLESGDTIPQEFDRTTKFYSQYWPEAADESNLLSGKFFPLVLPKHQKDVSRFFEICETKLYSNRIQFFIKEKHLKDFVTNPLKGQKADPEDKSKDLEIIVIDFK